MLMMMMIHMIERITSNSRLPPYVSSVRSNYIVNLFDFPAAIHLSKGL